jgi:hypothetical protein
MVLSGLEVVLRQRITQQPFGVSATAATAVRYNASLNF